MLLTGAQIVLECLLEQEVDTVFGYPGGQVLNIYDALWEYQDRITHIRTSHEQGAAHAADGYARASGKTGVCIATSGPGATNLVTGIATAYMDSVPMVAITGNVSRNLLGLDSFQEVDITGITMPITKHNYIVKRVEDLADTIREAFYIANNGRKGPVLVDIPKDVTAAKFDYQPARPSRPVPKMDLDPKQLDQVLQLLSGCRKPFLYAGGGVISSGAARELAEFANKLDAPVACSLMCQGGFDQKSDRYMGMLGMHGTKTASLAISECDILIAVGSRFSDRVTCNADQFAKNRPIVHIDVDPAEFNKNIPAQYTLKGDIRQVLELLCREMRSRDNSDWMQKIHHWKKEYPLYQTTPNPEGVTPQRILETLTELTDSDAILTTEVGQHQMWTAQFYEFRRPRTMITSGGLGTMGFGLGAAMGAQLAQPGKRVVNIAGDGSFHMNANELYTLSRYNIPVIEMVFDNQVLGMVRQWQKLFYDGHFSQTDLEPKTDYTLLAQAYGIKAFTIAREEDIRPALEAALDYNGPVMIHCVLDKDINVLPMVPAGASVESPILEIE